jgi:Rieske 2Fe-2S family protein
VNSRGYVPGPYCEETEQLVMRFTDWYCAAARGYLDHASDQARLAPARRRLAGLAVRGG